MKKIEESKSSSSMGCLSLVVLVLGMAPMGLFFWLDKMGLKKHHMPEFISQADLGDKGYFIVIGAFLFISYLSLALTNSEKSLKIVSSILLVLAIMNLGGCMQMWQGFNDAFG